VVKTSGKIVSEYSGHTGGKQMKNRFSRGATALFSAECSGVC
jgi:hypothetical protein